MQNISPLEQLRSSFDGIRTRIESDVYEYEKLDLSKVDKDKFLDYSRFIKEDFVHKNLGCYNFIPQCGQNFAVALSVAAKDLKHCGGKDELVSKLNAAAQIAMWQESF